MRSRNLEEVREEVEAIRDSEDKPIEKKIKDLVIGLRRWGIETKMSCEGHPDSSMPYPWVTFPLSQVEKVARIIAQWNYGQSKSVRRWVIRPAAESYLFPEDTNKPLKELQKEVKKLSIWLRKVEDPFLR